jgi:hypothetical protein
MKHIYGTLLFCFALVFASTVVTVAQTTIPEKTQRTAPGNEAPLFGEGQEFVWAEGMMRADNLTEKTELAFDTVTRFECYTRGGRWLVGSEAYCLEAAASVVLGTPTIQIAYFPVKSWGPELILAADSPSASTPICVWSQITINLREKSVIVTDIKKTGPGHEGFHNSCSEVPALQTYHLVYTPIEMMRRKIRAAEHRKSAE